MWGTWGKSWLTVLMVTVSLSFLPVTAKAADTWERGALAPAQAGPQSSLEAQMLGEKPFQTRTAPASPWAALLSGIGLQVDEGGTALKLPLNLEMHISVHYNREPAQLEPQKRSDSLLMSSSLDYRLLANLKVGLNAYLYRPDAGDNLSLARPFGGDRVMGLGPGLKYDLGRWSFLLKSQLETGSRERGSDLQNTVRVWYSF